MSQEILINVSAAEIRVAVVEGGKLQALTCERTLGAADESGAAGGRSSVGDIVLGRAVRIVSAVQAAFVEIGQDRAGFLGAHEARCLGEASGEPTIGELVREGDEVLVQIVKDPIGEKGARLSASVTIPGRLCVLAPYQSGVALSRRIEDEAERIRLAALGEALVSDTGDDLVPGAGYIFRTAAIGAELDGLRDDAVRLARDWRAIMAARKQAKPPALLHRDLDAVARAIRDVVHDDTARILIDDAEAAEAARDFCRRAAPGVESRIELFTGPGALFDMHDLENDIDGLLHPRVALPCGGWITIERTEALTAVDINSGSFTQAAAIEDTSLAVNLEAAQEIGRQVRLRGIGGLVVVDFIHMRDDAHAMCVVAALAEHLAKDGVPVTISPMSQFGLVELTRKRVREPLASLVGESCGAYAGQGILRRPDAVAMDILRRVEAGARAAPGKAIRVHAAPEVVAWIAGQGEKLRAALARRGAAQVSFVPDQNYSRERFDVGTVA